MKTVINAALPTCLLISRFSFVRFGRVASTLSDGNRSSLLAAYSDGIRCYTSISQSHNVTTFNK